MKKHNICNNCQNDGYCSQDSRDNCMANDFINFQSNKTENEIICPYCSHHYELGDTGEMGFTEKLTDECDSITGEYNCDNCRKTFKITSRMTVTYTFDTSIL